MRSFVSSVFAVVLVASTGPALADGTYRGAASVAGGRSPVCAGNNPMEAVVSGSSITLVGAVYEGAGDLGRGTVRADGSFTATKPTNAGPVTFTGRVSAGSVVAQWKGPDCYGAIDLGR